MAKRDVCEHDLEWGACCTKGARLRDPRGRRVPYSEIGGFTRQEAFAAVLEALADELDEAIRGVSDRLGLYPVVDAIRRVAAAARS